MTKKRLAFAVAILALSVVTTVVSVKQTSSISMLFKDGVEALAYSGENPGPQGQRQSEAVLCSNGKIAAGCCFGGSTCNTIYCTGSASFTCDGTHYVPFG